MELSIKKLGQYLSIGNDRIGKYLSIENDRKGENLYKKKNRKENIIRERQSRTKENSVYTITKDNTSYELHMEKMQGITLLTRKLKNDYDQCTKITYHVKM